MSNIRTANKRHKRAIIANIARHRVTEPAATDNSDRSISEPVKAAI